MHHKSWNSAEIHAEAEMALVYNAPDGVSKFGESNEQSELDGVVVHSGNEEPFRCANEDKTMSSSFCYSQESLSMNPDMGMESELKPAPRMGDPGMKRASFTTRIKSEMKRISTFRGNKESINGVSGDGSVSHSKANRRVKFDRTVSSAERGLKSLRFLDKNVGAKEKDAAWQTVEKRFEQFAVKGRVSKENFGACIGMKDSKEFAVELFDALARRKGLKTNCLSKDELYQFWQEMADQNFDSRLQIFFDMCDKNGDGRISEDEVKEVIVLSASANKLAKLKENAAEYAGLIMEELDPDHLGYIEIWQLDALLQGMVNTYGNEGCVKHSKTLSKTMIPKRWRSPIYRFLEVAKDFSRNLEHGLSQNLPPRVLQPSESTESLNTGDDNEGDHSGRDNINHHEVKLDLTDDLIHMVFSFLDHKTLCTTGLVCRQWHAASVHEDFWRCLNFENCRITAEQVVKLCRRYTRAVELHLPGSLLDIPVREALRTLRSLEVLTIDRGTLSDAFFSLLADFPVLNRLVITEAALERGGTQEIHIHHESLRYLEVMRCRALRISVSCSLLETLSLKRSSISSAILSCPLLRELDVSSCHKLSDPGVRGAAISCPLLQSLDISNCSYVSDDTLREIAAACTDIRFLDASHCPNISLEAVRMPRLVDLRIHNCEGINATSMAALSQCFFLEALQLDFCWLLTSVTLDLPRLRHISLVNCRKIVELNLSSPALVSINVTSCPILNRVDITSTALEKLVLQKQQSLTTITLQCLHLSEVDLTECESLTNSICEVFSVGGGCPMLNTLILDSCESLSNVNLNSVSLHILSLTGCRGVTNLQLACPSLQKICLDGCDHLERASFSPVGLCSLNLGICPHLTELEIRAPQMTSLELKGCGVLSQADIDCPQLHSLDASFCSLLNDDCLAAATAACPSIELLVLMSCTSIGPEGLLALQRLSNLTLLDLSYTFLTNLQPIIDSCPQLKVLKLQACKYLENSALIPLHRGRALPKLCELDLSYGTLSQSAIEELLAWCPHLTHLSLNGCVNMHDLDWRFQASHSYSDSELHRKQNKSDLRDDQIHVEGSPKRSLQHLNCVGCANIKKIVIPASAYCMSLSSLNLSLSANIQEVNLACLNLATLNLSNCIALEILKLDCPRLTSLLLQACGIGEQELECTIQSCNLLETLDVRSCPKVSSTSIAKLRLISPDLKRIFSSF